MAWCIDCGQQCDCNDRQCHGFHAKSGCLCSRCADAFFAPKPKRLTLLEMFEQEIAGKEQNQ
jgi:hypothetical protein